MKSLPWYHLLLLDHNKKQSVQDCLNSCCTLALSCGVFQWSCLLRQSIASCSGSVIQVPCLVCSECCRMSFISVIPSCSETVASCSGSLIIVSCLVCSECHKTCFYFSDSNSLWDILLFLLEFSTFSARLCLLGMQ